MHEQKSKILTDNKFKKLNKSVLLFSGGMDSLIFDKLLNPDVLLYIPMNSSYQEMETKKIQELVDKGYIDGSKLVILDDVLNLSRFERDDMIVPCRNSMIITLASMFGETIYLGSVYGDASCDKSLEFFEKQEILLNQMWQEQHWCEGREIKILDPYKSYTKTEIVKLFLEKGGDPDALLTSYSCYEGHEQPCGTCKPCFRKLVSMQNNDINVDGYTKRKFFEAEWLPELLPRIQKGEYRGREDVDIMNALEKSGYFKEH